MAPSSKMSVAQLRAFVLSARTGSFTAAGEQLNLAQASVSESVRRLEEEYGLVLFVRGPRKLTLTSAGELLLPAAQRAVTGLDDADSCLRAFGGLTGGVATFGVMRNAEFYLLTDLVQTFHSRYPGVQVRLIGQNSVRVAEAVTNGDIEAGVVVLPVDVSALDVRPLLRDEVVLVTREPQRYGTRVTAKQLAAAPLVLYDAYFGWNDPTRRQIAELAAREGVRIEPVIEVEHVTLALELVSRGVGDTVVSRAVTQAPNFPSGLHVISFSEPLYDVVVSITRDAGILSPASRELLLMAEAMIMSRSSNESLGPSD